ncbi:hypothetical protein BH11PSE6_BH11PSE6_23220 [soil metagenome]
MRHAALRVAVAAFLATFSVAATAQVPTTLPAQVVPPASPVQTPAEALARDAADYARQNGVPLGEAIFRLRAQQESVPATDRLQLLYKDRLAGIAIEHHPEYRIVVLLTGTQPVADEAVFAGGRQVPITFRTGAPATRDRIVAAIERHQAEIRAALPRPPGMGADPRTGELVVTVNNADAGGIDRPALTAKLTDLAGVPVRLRILGRDVDTGAMDVGGGSRVVGINPLDGRRYACTTGFVVTDGARTGIVTSAHCPDTLSYVDPARHETPLAFICQWGWGFQDVQVHVSDAALRPLFYADSAKTEARPVTTWRKRTSTRAGDFVCHRGETTGYSCAQVDMVDFAPAGDLCGGACLPTWVAVNGPVCQGGDSGAPVFSGTVAFGIVKGASYRADKSCILYYYMSTDYLPSGWSLLHGLGALPEVGSP